MTVNKTRRQLAAALSAAFLFMGGASLAHAATARWGHTATLMSTGDVLIAGGATGTEAAPGYTTNVEVVETSRGGGISARSTVNFVARASHTATNLPSGCVLVVGGRNGGGLVGSAQVYDPLNDAWSVASANAGYSRMNHTATLLNNGKVLICGGEDPAGAGTTLNTCVLYTPPAGGGCTNGTVAATAGNMLQGRALHTATLLKDGKVWFAGGRRSELLPGTNPHLSTTERYNPATDSFQSASPLIEGRAYHTATLMGDGKVLVAGGYNRAGNSNAEGAFGMMRSAEIFDPVGNSVTPAAQMTTNRFMHAAVLDASGVVQAFGGLGTVTTTYLIPTGTLPTGLATLRSTFKPLISRQSTVSVASAISLPMDFTLQRAVTGRIAEGEVWLTTPSVAFSNGIVYFTQADPDNAGVGLRVNLSGVNVSDGEIEGNIPLSNLQGDVYFSPKNVAITGTLAAGAGNLVWTGGVLSNVNSNLPVTPGTSLTADFKITMDEELFNAVIDSGTVVINAGAINTQYFDVDIDEAQIRLPNGGAAETVFFDGVSNTYVIDLVNQAVTLYDASMIWDGGEEVAQTFTSPHAMPTAGGPNAFSLTGRLDFTADRVNLAGKTFTVGLSTVVIRQMVFGDAEFYDPKNNQWALTAPGGGDITWAPGHQRIGGAATLLVNNDVLYTGGRECAAAGCNGLSYAAKGGGGETGVLFQFQKNFSGLGSLQSGRVFHTTTLLPDGKMLAAGGTNGPYILNDAEIIDPVTGAGAATNGRMSTPRDLHTATLMTNGRVLIAGGFTTTATSTGSTKLVDIYYPDTKVFLPTTPMISSRSNHTAITLPNGTIFAAGGFGENDVISNTAEVYNSTSGVWTAVKAMPADCARAIHTAVLLKTGKVLLIGGVNDQGVMNSSALYDPDTNTWNNDPTNATGCGAGAAVDLMPTPLRSHTATLLFDGRVLVAGGNDGFGEVRTAYIYDPGDGAGGSWTLTEAAGDSLLQGRFNHTATLLPNGDVMISGGSQRFGNITTSIEVFHVTASSWVTGGMPGAGGMSFANGARGFHTMTLGHNNKIYAVGGSDGQVGGGGATLRTTVEAGYFTTAPDTFSKGSPPSLRQSTVTYAKNTLATPTEFLEADGQLRLQGLQFRGGTEASGGGSGAANSDFNIQHVILQRLDGSGGAASQSDAGFAVDLTTEVYLQSGNFDSFDNDITVDLPATAQKLPLGWYVIRQGANDIYSEGRVIQVSSPTPTLPVTALTPTVVSQTRVDWNWTAPAQAVDGYSIYNSETGILISTTSGTSWPQTGLIAGGTASITVAPFRIAGDGPRVVGTTAYTLTNPPVVLAPTQITASSMRIDWTFAGNNFPDTVYELTYSTDVAPNAPFQTVTTSTPVPFAAQFSTNNFTVTGLIPSTQYAFRMRSFNKAGVPSGTAPPAGYSNIVIANTATPISGLIGVPVASTQTRWSWNDAGPTASYEIFNATTGALLGVSPAGTPTFLDVGDGLGLGTNTARSVLVRSVIALNPGPLAPSPTVYTLALAPQLINPPVTPVTLTTGSFTAVWNPTENPFGTNYVITLNELDASNVAVSTVQFTTNTAQFPFSGLKASTKYAMRVLARNDDLVQTAELSLGATFTLALTPSSVTVTGTDPFSIAIAWNANGNGPGTRYQVIYDDTDFTNLWSTAVAFSDNYTSTTFTITGLQTSVTYFIRVAAFNPFGTPSALTTTVSTRTFNGGAPLGSVAGLVTRANNSTIFGSLGNGRVITLRVPANGFPQDLNVTISSRDIPGVLCPGGANIAFDIVNDLGLQPNAALYFTFGLTAGEQAALPSRAMLMRFDPGSGTCVPLETTLVNGQMTARINHFSLFQVAAAPAATGTSDARIFPNPYFAARDGFVTLDRVPPGSRVRIFTLRGEEVLDQKANAGGLLTWSGTNGAGRAVASGLYIVHIESGGSRKIMKLSIIR